MLTSLNPIVTVAPAALPVALADVKDQLSIDPSVADYDTRLTGLIYAATEAVEIFIGRSLITRQYQAAMDWWPINANGCVQRHVSLPMGPLISVQSITTFDDADVATVMSPTLYFVDVNRTVGRIVLRRGQVWPIPYRAASGIVVAWMAGYGASAANVPPPIALAIRAMVGDLNEARGDETAPPDVPPTVRGLLLPYVVGQA